MAKRTGAKVVADPKYIGARSVALAFGCKFSFILARICLFESVEQRLLYTPLAVVLVSAKTLHVSTTAPHDANSDVSSKEGAVIISTRNAHWGHH
jgi:hypothetical protein